MAALMSPFRTLVLIASVGMLCVMTLSVPVRAQKRTCPCIPGAHCQGGQYIIRPDAPPPGWTCIYGWQDSDPCSAVWAIDSTLTLCRFNGVASPFGSLGLGCCYPPTVCYMIRPVDGALGTCSSTMPSGSSCTFSCRAGYTLDTPLTNCTDGRPAFQRCIPPPCQLTLPANAVDMGTCAPFNGSLPSEQTCYPRCAPGYYASGPTSCTAGSLASTTCVEKKCPFPSAPVAGSSGTCIGSGSYIGEQAFPGATCTLSCNSGYSLTPQGPATCRLGQFQPLQICGAPCSAQPPAHGRLGQCPTALKSGAACQYACEPGYTLVGAATTCDDGTLTPQQCLRVCPVAAPANGAFNNCPTSLASGASCSISCNDGYAVVGAATTCVDGSITSQSCAPAPCPVASPTNGALNGCPASLPSGSSCTFSCNTGYTLSETSTSCLAGVLTAQTCLTPEEIAAANAARTASGHSTASGLPPGVQEALISIVSTLGAAAAAFGGWYWKRSNDARKRAQRRALAAAIFEHLPFVDADAFDSPTGQEFTDAVDALARRVGQAYPKLMHGLLINHPRLPLPQLEELGRAISASARAAGLELNAPTMPAVVACIFRCQQFKGALVTHFADEHMQRAIVVALGTTLEDDRMQAALRALAIKLKAQVTPDVQPGFGEAADAATSPLEGVEVELTAGMPSSDA